MEWQSIKLAIYGRAAVIEQHIILHLIVKFSGFEYWCIFLENNRIIYVCKPRRMPERDIILLHESLRGCFVRIMSLVVTE